MYFSFIKFFAGFLAFLIPVLLFYLTVKSKINKKRILKIVYWLVPIGFAAMFLLIRYFAVKTGGVKIQKITAWLLAGYMLYLIPFLLFAIFYWFDCGLKILFKNKNFRLKYFVGLPLAILSFGAVVSGIFNRYNLEVRYLEVEVEGLPTEFDNLKIAVMGDTHLGNLTGYGDYLRLIRDTINSQNVDLLFFTGDLVNTMPKEIRNFTHYFRQINTRYGRYAVMGNHDFCGYFRWSSNAVKEANANDVKQIYKGIGFGLLDNDYTLLEKDSLNSICIAGVDEGGKIAEVMQKMPEKTFKMLLLHNPKNWEQLIEKQDIAVTFSGHTHAWQCGFKIGGKTYSPSRFLFKYFDGLYSKNGKRLFVTRGVGYVGAPVRIGLKPEVSIIILKNKKKSNYQ